MPHLRYAHALGALRKAQSLALEIVRCSGMALAVLAGTILWAVSRANSPLIGRWALPLLTSVMLCSLAGPANADVRVPTHVACVGDSITEGFAASNPATKSYPAQLQLLFGSQVSVKNFGRSGTTMLSQGFGDNPYENTLDYQNATNFVKGAPANAVVDVIIMLGANDSKPNNWTPPGK